VLKFTESDVFFVNLQQSFSINQIFKPMLSTSNLVDNPFLRQYEIKIGSDMATIEYSQQDRKIFLTKLIIPEVLDSNGFSEDFIKVVLDNISEKNISVVPTSPPIAKFIKRHRRYKKMLPVGIRI
jgi:predicted GNAT family acetyltransferase|tara:strand:+ start:757 stop:1131 length:375 start_codon:yes stop_codon:yes gene_type:complete